MISALTGFQELTEIYGHQICFWTGVIGVWTLKYMEICFAGDWILLDHGLIYDDFFSGENIDIWLLKRKEKTRSRHEKVPIFKLNSTLCYITVYRSS